MQTEHGVELLEQVGGEWDELLVGWKRHVPSLWVLLKILKQDASRRRLRFGFFRSLMRPRSGGHGDEATRFLRR
jgi:hypothetical protein